MSSAFVLNKMDVHVPMLKSKVVCVELCIEVFYGYAVIQKKYILLLAMFTHERSFKVKTNAFFHPHLVIMPYMIIQTITFIYHVH